MDRTFGVEVEFYMPVGMNAVQLAKLITRAGVECHDESWNHITRSHWKLVTDRSLGDMVRGREVVSPVLQGEAGQTAMATVLRAVREAGCTISRRCGVHVHIGVDGAPLQFFRNLLRNYGHFEPVIDSLMPASRRLDLNGYCKSVAHVPPTAVAQAGSLAALGALLAQDVSFQRYHKLNLRPCYDRYRTVEFRQHSATLDAVKVAHWIAFCQRMVERAMGARLVTEVAGSDASAQTVNPMPPGTKGWQLVELMRRPGGVSGPEAIAAMGWPGGISLSHEARRMGVAVRTQRMGRVVRYYATGAVTQMSPVGPTLDSLFQALGCPAAEREYFRGRAALLAGHSTDAQAA